MDEPMNPESSTRSKALFNKIILKTYSGMQGATGKTRETFGKIQRKLGENYYAILEENPLILDTLSRSKLLIDNQELLSTVFNVPWATTLLWSAAAGGFAVGQEQIARGLGELCHYGPGHIQRWEEINKFMDSVSGIGHRLKFGHSIDFLPHIVEEFGIDGVPAFFMHLVQDATTLHGIPIIPRSWDVKDFLQSKNVPCKMATGLVSISFTSILGALAVVMLISQLWEFGKAHLIKKKTNKFIETANVAFQNQDYEGAAANYESALEIEHSPYIMMALGQAYIQRAATRLRAHLIFGETVKMLSSKPDAIVPYFHGKISIRGLAGIYALSTAEVLGNIHQEHWNDHIRNLVNATVFSFSSAAKVLSKQMDSSLPLKFYAPSYFSAAINYYLAAKSACHFPFAEESENKVKRNLRAALYCLELLLQCDEATLLTPVDKIQQLWIRELLPQDKIASVCQSR